MTYKGETELLASDYCNLLSQEAKDQWLAM